MRADQLHPYRLKAQKPSRLDRRIGCGSAVAGFLFFLSLELHWGQEDPGAGCRRWYFCSGSVRGLSSIWQKTLFSLFGQREDYGPI